MFHTNKFNIISSVVTLSKMTGHIITFKRKHFNWLNSSGKYIVLMKSNYSDVTLVSDDQKLFHAHRFILSAFSPFFKNILLNNPNPHPLIYLRGIHNEDLYSILQFIYLGKVSVFPNNIKRFALAAQDLQVKKLADNNRLGN